MDFCVHHGTSSLAPLYILKIGSGELGEERKGKEVLLCQWNHPCRVLDIPQVAYNVLTAIFWHYLLSLCLTFFQQWNSIGMQR